MQLAATAFEVDDMAAAVELCFAKKWTDGLPVVPPTPDAVERVIEYLGRDPAEPIGIIPPRDGVATIEAIAINSVMAGCKAEYVPFVIAVVEAMQEECFNLNGVQTTTHSCAPLVMVSGPAVKRLGFNTRECVLGHGCRASATIGRAVRLILWNVGGGYPGEPCKTTHGHPGYFSFCVAEDSETNPWEPLHVERGFRSDETVVTVCAVEGPRLVGTGSGYSPIDDVLYMLADSIATPGCNTISGAEMVLLLDPMSAKALAGARLSKLDIKRELMRLATRPVRDAKRRRSIAESHPMHWSHFADPRDDDALVPFVRSLEKLIILVTGGWGSGASFSSLCAGWGANRSQAVSKAVQFPA
jgi:hypothetical protein